MFDPNFIGIYDDAISSTECGTIIKWLETNDLWRGTFGYDEIDFTMKKAWQISTNVIEPPYYVQDIIRKGLNNNIVIYKETYSDVNRGPGCTWNVQSYYNIQKYDPEDGYYGLHCENDGIGSRNRVLAWMFYLNTVTDKGGTYFSSYDKTINAIHAEREGGRFPPPLEPISREEFDSYKDAISTLIIGGGPIEGLYNNKDAADLFLSSEITANFWKDEDVQQEIGAIAGGLIGPTVIGKANAAKKFLELAPRFAKMFAAFVGGATGAAPWADTYLEVFGYGLSEAAGEGAFHLIHK